MRPDVTIGEIEVKALHTTTYYRLNGNKKIFPISLNTTSSVKPTIRKGRRINQISGNKNNMSNASGQHTTNNRHQTARAINILINNKASFPSAYTVKGKLPEMTQIFPIHSLQKQDQEQKRTFLKVMKADGLSLKQFRTRQCT
jgi:hypothetical protein